MPLPTLGNLSTPLGIAGGNSVGAHAPAAVPAANTITPSLISGAFAGGQPAPYVAPQGAQPAAGAQFGYQPTQFGNMQPAQPPGMSPPPPSVGNGFAPFMAPSPQVTQALRGIPPGILQQLHSSGLIHPQLMSHVFRVQ
jgi:hypothetical protein